MPADYMFGYYVYTDHKQSVLILALTCCAIRVRHFYLKFYPPEADKLFAMWL